MAIKNRIEAIAELDAICDEFEREVIQRQGPVQLEPWLGRVDGELRPWLRRELKALYRELRAEVTAVDGRFEFEEPAIRKGARSQLATSHSDDVPIGVNPKIWRAIKRNTTFQPLSNGAKEALARGIRAIQFPADATLLRSGQPASGLYLILDGEVEVLVREGTRRATLDRDGRGSVMGEISTITGEPCTADVIAVTPVSALMLPADAFERIRSRHPEVEIALSQLVSDRLGQQSRDALCGKSLGGYRLQRCLSTGAMGVVYRATRESDDSLCALKMLRHRFIYSPQVVSRFEQEVDFLAGLNHPNVVSMRGHFIAYKTRFIVLDLYDGMDLRRWLREHGPLDETVAKGILGQIADGLRYAHRQGVLHLDLKPANVLINRQGEIAITDFGLSKLMESDGCDSEAVGTPLYMPPEQFTMTDVGPHCDHYAFGCIAYELLTAENPFLGAGDDVDLFQRKERVPNSKWPTLDASSEYRKLVRGSLQPSISKRKLDLDAIASWSRPVPELFDRLNRSPR